jgi:hypothetical protein
MSQGSLPLVGKAAAGFAFISVGRTPGRLLRLDYRDRRLRPGPEDRVAARGQAVAVNLRRRDKEGVMKPMARETGGEAWQERAGTRRDRGVDRVDAVGEARDDLV